MLDSVEDDRVGKRWMSCVIFKDVVDVIDQDPTLVQAPNNQHKHGQYKTISLADLQLSSSHRQLSFKFIPI